MASVGHVRRAMGDPPPFVHPKTRKGAGPLSDDDDDDEADEPGFENHRDDGRAYHNNCAPLAATRPQTVQAAPQQAGKLVAGVGVQLGMGRPQNG